MSILLFRSTLPTTTLLPSQFCFSETLLNWLQTSGIVLGLRFNVHLIYLGKRYYLSFSLSFGLEYWVVDASQWRYVSPLWCSYSAESTSILSKDRVVFSGLPEVNVAKCQASTNYWLQATGGKNDIVCFAKVVENISILSNFAGLRSHTSNWNEFEQIVGDVNEYLLFLQFRCSVLKIFVAFINSGLCSSMINRGILSYFWILFQI